MTNRHSAQATADDNITQTKDGGDVPDTGHHDQKQIDGENWFQIQSSDKIRAEYRETELKAKLLNPYGLVCLLCIALMGSSKQGQLIRIDLKRMFITESKNDVYSKRPFSLQFLRLPFAVFYVHKQESFSSHEKGGKTLTTFWFTSKRKLEEKILFFFCQ